MHFTPHILDVISLYPSIENKLLTPKQLHPHILPSESFPDNGRNLPHSYISRYPFGIWSVQVLPSRAVEVPILPMRIRSKVVWANCFTCTETMSSSVECPHESLRQRSFHVNTTSQELDLFIQDGGKVLYVFEMYDWSSKGFRDDLFKNMIRVSPFSCFYM